MATAGLAAADHQHVQGRAREPRACHLRQSRRICREQIVLVVSFGGSSAATVSGHLCTRGAIQVETRWRRPIRASQQAMGLPRLTSWEDADARPAAGGHPGLFGTLAPSDAR